MTDYARIYATQAEAYERLVVREDAAGMILPTLSAIRPLAGLDVIELGAGTGRLTRLLAPHVRAIRAFDESPAMLKVAREHLDATSLHNWRLDVADHRHLPVPDQSADLVLGGWTICYAALWSEDDWANDLQLVLQEMERVLRPGGTLIILETLGTGYETPHPPHELLSYFGFLAHAGFQETWIRTDYEFESAEEAQELTRFFFGDALAQ